MAVSEAVAGQSGGGQATGRRRSDEEMLQRLNGVATTPIGHETSVVRIGFPTLSAFVQQYGGAAATAVLLNAARVIGNTTRCSDYSFQTDEFVFEVVLFGCSPTDAAGVVNRIRYALEAAETFPHRELPLSTSVVTTVAP